MIYIHACFLSFCFLPLIRVRVAWATAFMHVYSLFTSQIYMEVFLHICSKRSLIDGQSEVYVCHRHKKRFKTETKINALSHTYKRDTAQT